MMQSWNALFECIKNVRLLSDADTLVWNYEANGIYSVSSLYKIVNFRGAIPGKGPKVWEVKIPPRVQIFIWLAFNNKLLTRDNLSKRQHVDDLSCLFCAEHETGRHLFFECVVAKEIWRDINDLADMANITNIASMLEWWHSNSNTSLKIYQAAAMWALWKLRNDMYFGRAMWSNMQGVWRKMAAMLSAWEILYSGLVNDRVRWLVARLEQNIREPPLLMWPDPG
uniref:Reverse transcriptase zinc-binding domain-containing protein n=1 Tax=Aegilops tauschii subsp. strangulata TaxID=200361 RepID=A0A453A1X4_AEGTS